MAETVGQAWGNQPITPAQATAFAQATGIAPEDRSIVAKNLLSYPPDMEVRGLFLEGLFRILEQRLGASGVTQIRRAAGLPEHIIPFRQYAHRDFYKLYYLTAARLHPSAPFGTALRRVAQAFFPIFRGSMFGRTMSALMGHEPRTILPLLAKAYNVSVNGNSHTSQMTGESELSWRCRVEPVEWYEQTFTGIIEGTMNDSQRSKLEVVTKSRSIGPTSASYEFVIRW